jgi:radial spoke head protein 4A
MCACYIFPFRSRYQIIYLEDRYSIHNKVFKRLYRNFSRRKFENIYVGWGQKYLPHGYTPPNLPPVMEEFPGGADITEIDDPTVEEEQEAKARQEVDVEPGDDGDDVDDEDDDD